MYNKYNSGKEHFMVCIILLDLYVFGLSITHSLIQERKEIMINENKISEFVEEFYGSFDHVRLTKWNYEDGCILMAAIQLYEATGKSLFRDFIISYVDAYVEEDGTIKTFKKEDYNLDNIAPGRALIFAHEHTGNEKFYKAVEKLMEQINEQPRTRSGNFWHKKIYPNQVWLDGLYMAQPFYMAYETKYGKKENCQDIVKQFLGVRKYMFDPEKQLHYHGFDESEEVFWAKKPGGCSENFWLRAIAWYQMAIIDTAEEMSKAIYEHYRTLADLFQESIKGLIQYQDKESSLFYQLIALPKQEGNYLETSGSAMLAAAILKACRMKIILSEKYEEIAENILNSIIDNKLVVMDGKYTLIDINAVSGLGPKDNLRRDGSINYYLSEPIVSNDNKGIAALFMAYAQYLKLKKLK